MTMPAPSPSPMPDLLRDLARAKATFQLRAVMAVIGDRPMTKTAPELLPCPFCGCEATLRDDSYHKTAFYIGCQTPGCLGSDQWEETQAEAVAAWNTRILAAIEPAPVSVREAARVLLDEWRQGDGPLGELCCYSLDEDGTMQPDIDGRWVEFTKIEAALFRAITGDKTDD